MSKGMRRVSNPLKVRKRMMRAGKRLVHVPYCGWQRNAKKKHKWGVLRMWPKWKVVRTVWGRGGAPTVGGLDKSSPSSSSPSSPPAEPPASAALPREDVVDVAFEGQDPWAALKWRPLVSYSSHYWKRVLTLVGKFSVYALRRLKIGIGVNSPRSILERFHEFNAAERVPRKDRLSADDGGEPQREGQPPQAQAPPFLPLPRGAPQRRAPRAAAKRGKVGAWFGRKKKMRHWTGARGTRSAADEARLRSLGRRLTDIKNFFTEIPRDIFEERLEQLLRWIQELDPKWRFF